MANKTKKYYLEIASYNLSFEKFEITQKKFNEMLTTYKKAIKDNHELNNESDTEYFVNYEKKTTETNEKTRTEHIIKDGQTYIILSSVILKDGFVFAR